MNQLKLGKQLRNVLFNSSAIDAAQLLSTIANIHSGTVRWLLYRDDRGILVPDDNLASRLAKRIKESDDSKGAGLLLSATHRVDALYCSTEDTFAGRLARHLGEDFAFEQVKREIRPSVLYYLLRGLWEAGASYRGEVEDRAFDLIVSTIKSPYRAHRPFAAQLALLLAADEHFGEKFLERLANAFSCTRTRPPIVGSLHQGR
mgnify:CR=1 FL=1